MEAKVDRHDWLVRMMSVVVSPFYVKCGSLMWADGDDRRVEQRRGVLCNNPNSIFNLLYCAYAHTGHNFSAVFGDPRGGWVWE